MIPTAAPTPSRLAAWLSALACAFTLPLLALIIRPFAEVGIDDDWSYIRTAQLLAQTGHIVYNGWATAMLGWQLYAGALMVHLFGFSFTNVRLSTLLLGMLTAVLAHRTFLRTGLGTSLSTLATLTLVASPLFLALTYDFMSDIPGLLVVIACIFCCLRALQAHSDRRTLAWLLAAIVSNAAGGTARQIAWLGVLVMVPSALWLLRRRPAVLIPGAFACLLGAASIFWSLHWFHQQPYSVPEPLLRGTWTAHTVLALAGRLLAAALDLALFLLPVLLPFPLAFLRDTRIKPALKQRLTLAFLVLLVPAIVLGIRPRYHDLLAPFLGQDVSMYGVGGIISLKGEFIQVLSNPVRLALTLTVLTAIFFFAAFWFTRTPPAQRPPSQPPLSQSPSLRTLRILLAPFFLAYVVLLMPRAPFHGIYDRYLLPLLFLTLIALLRFYQAHVSPHAPRLAFALVALFAAYAAIARHDDFASRRAVLTMTDRLRAQSIPRNQIDALWEYNGWTQIEQTGYTSDPTIKMPAGLPAPIPGTPAPVPDPCPLTERRAFAAIHPRYILSLDPRACGGLLPIDPVPYRTWLSPRQRTLYIVKP